jgi:hypothetical protein
MEPSALNNEQAYSAGSNLWVVADRESSDWTIQLDWYINFQLAKALIRKRMKVPQHLIDWAKSAEVEAVDLMTDDNGPMLVHTAKLLPNNQVLHLPYKNNLSQWISYVEAIWTRLGKPSTRIFLPNSASVEDASKIKSELARSASFVKTLRR